MPPHPCKIEIRSEFSSIALGILEICDIFKSVASISSLVLLNSDGAFSFSFDN